MHNLPSQSIPMTSFPVLMLMSLPPVPEAFQTKVVLKHEFSERPSFLFTWLKRILSFKI